METYLIREENMDRLEKKLETIRKKCEASKCSFTFNIKPDRIYKDGQDEDGNDCTFCYREVEVDGTARYEGWRFVATLDHHEAGNVIRAFDHELVIPEKYQTCGPTCEHCNKIRSRKDTYLIYNDETGEFKQVGKSCLQEFTNGLSAENVAFFCSVYEQIEGLGGYTGPSFNRYISVEQILNYAFECYKHWGYQKSRYSFEEDVPVGYRSTKERVVDYYYIDRASGEHRLTLLDEMEAVGFNPESEYAKTSTEGALNWIKSLTEDELIGNQYLRNLHVLCSDDYVDYRSLGVLVSLPIAYDKHLGQVKEKEEKERAHEAEKSSEYIGEIKERITVPVTSFTCVSAWDTLYGTTYLYKFTDEAGNILIWYASNPVNEEDSVVSVTGTIKDHSEFQGVKQTVLTRCKVAHAEQKEG